MEKKYLGHIVLYFATEAMQSIDLTPTNNIRGKHLISNIVNKFQFPKANVTIVNSV